MSTTLLETKKKENGVVYTPSNLAEYVANKVVEYALTERTAPIHNFKIIDPACGEGDLLIPTWHALMSFSEKKNSTSVNLRAQDVLCGIDIDAASVAKTSTTISALTRVNTGKPNNLLAANALFPQSKRFKINNWSDAKELFDAEAGFDILIANPPWGANTSAYQDKLAKGTYKLSKGQYDSSDLFVELALSIVKEGGHFALILPDSLFAFERRELRKMLLDNTEIKFIARLGEKIFEGVNRACVVVIGKKTNPSLKAQTTCMRLTPSLRKNILDGVITFADAEKQLAHVASQMRFSADKDLLFDIDTKEEELAVLKKISASKITMGEYVFSSRGVELSKSGKICRCTDCGFWIPLPNSERTKCSHCGAILRLGKMETRTIISKKKFKGSKPILVGESVKRYSISSRLWIAVDNKGINYKTLSLYYEPKILVRKTGVGITATIDYSNALTNQVVYIFKPHQDVQNPIPIEFVLAIMNSRAIYYHLLKRYGETEWRSHPYLTQSQILGLPMPDLSSKSARALQTKIVNFLKPYLEKQNPIPKDIDAKVESLVATLFSLSRSDYELIYKTLDCTQGLIPVRELSAVGVNDIFK